MSASIVDNTVYWVRQIEPRKYAHRRFEYVADRQTLESVPQFRFFTVFTDDFRSGLFFNPPYNSEMRYSLIVRVAYPVEGYTADEIENIVISDIMDIRKQLTNNNLEDGILGRWFNSANIQRDTTLGILYVDMMYNCIQEFENA